MAFDPLAPGATAGVRVRAERCVHALDAFAQCRICADECPANALRIDETVVLDPVHCTACGACVHACPVGAFEARDVTHDVLRCASRAGSEGAIALLCAHHPPTEHGAQPVDAAIVIGECLAALGPSVYAGLAALGVTRIDVYLDACADCPLGARASIERTLDKARGVLRPWVEAEPIVAITGLADGTTGPRWTVYFADQPPISRRRLLNPFAANDADDRLDALAIDPAALPGPKRVPNERLRLLHALALLPPAGQALCPAPQAGQVFMRVGAEDGCTACGACEKACPSGALDLEIDDHTRAFRLTHLAAICTGCEACLHLCDPGVLYSRGVPFTGALQTPAEEAIATGRFDRCKRCKARVAEGTLTPEGLCEVCAFRRANPFGSQLPPRARSLLERQQRTASRPG